ncbi:hypothetical protein [Rahnella sp. ChDrAdgB13]|uniref:hypothetical protein n=1 Tax=Rahnella sp. ChDrAdgB13 TaxID=1850581 RepID=UPI001AD858D0|nr:hypothetical protein [Rahnella sp. ChDrAdgB13]
MSQQDEKLTIDQKIQIARLATDIYMTEYPSGHSAFLRAENNGGKGSPLSNAEIEIAALEQKKQDIRNSFQGIYHSIENAITGESDNAR